MGFTKEEKKAKKELKKESKAAKKAQKASGKKAAKGVRKTDKKFTKKLQKTSLGMKTRPQIESAIRKRDLITFGGDWNVQEIAVAIVKETQLRAPLIIGNTAVGPAMAVGYLMWAWYDKMRKVGLLVDPTNAVATTYNLNPFPAEAPIPSAWAKVIEYSMPYCDPRSGITYGKLFTWAGLPTFSQSNVNGSGTGLSFSQMYVISGTQSGAVTVGDYFYSASGTPSWNALATNVQEISGWFAQCFQCCCIAQIPDWAPDGSGTAWWQWDTTNNQHHATHFVEHFDPEVVVALKSPSAAGQQLEGGCIKAVGPILTARSDQVYANAYTTFTRMVISTWVTVLSDIPYRMGKVSKMYKRSASYPGLRSLVPHYVASDLSVYNDLKTNYVRLSSTVWTNSDNVLAFFTYCDAVMAARAARVMLHHSTAIAGFWGYNPSALSAALPPMMANFITAWGAVVNFGRLTVPILENPPSASYVAYLLNASTSAKDDGSPLTGNYCHTGLVNNPVINGVTFSGAVFTQSQYGRAPMAIWPVFATYVRKICDITSWVVPDDVPCGGVSGLMIGKLSDAANFNYTFASPATITQTIQCVVWEATSQIPLTPLELGQALCTLHLVGNTYQSYRYDKGYGQPSMAGEVQPLFLEDQSVLTNALGLRIGEKSKNDAVRVAGGGLEMKTGGETAVDSLRTVIAAELQAQLDDPSLTWEYISDKAHQGVQWMVGEAVRISRRKGERVKLSNPKDPGQVVMDIAKHLGVPHGAKQFALLNAEIAAEGALEWLRARQMDAI